MREGRIEGEVGGETQRPITQENIMTYAAGAAA
jgi:ribose transport system ATP-binding protein